MAPHLYNLLGLGVALITTAILYGLQRRRRERYFRLWIGTWLLLAVYCVVRSVPRVGEVPAAQAAAGAALLLAATCVAAMAGSSPLAARFRASHTVLLVLAPLWAAAVLMVSPPLTLQLASFAAAALLFVYAGFRFWSLARDSDLLSQRLMSLACWMLGGTFLVAAEPVIPALHAAGLVAVNYGLLALAVGMVFLVFEEGQRGMEENLLGLSSLNLATSAFPALDSLQDILKKVLERLLRVHGLKQGLITLERSERRAGVHLTLGFPAETAEEWGRRELDRTVTGLVARLGGLLIVRDLSELERAGRLESDPGYRGFCEVMRAAGVHSLLALSLQTKTGLYGALVLAVPPRLALSSTELRLVATLAGQIAMAVENFLLVQDSQRRAEELRLLNQTGQAMSSTLNPEALLRLVHQEIRKLMDAQNFYIALWDEAHDDIRFELEVEKGVYLPKRSRKMSKGMTEYVLRSRRPLLLRAGVAEFRRQQGIETGERVARSWLGVPLLLYERSIGVMAALNFDREYAYDDGHLDIMKTLAAQAAIALENARLFADEQRRLRQLSFLHNISRIGISTLNSDQMLSEIVREIQRNFAYDHIGIGLLDYQTKEVEIKAEAGTQAQALGRRIPLDVGVIGQVARSREMALVHDLLHEPDGARHQGILTNARSALCLPIVYADQMLGVLNVESVQENAFGRGEVLILRTLADHLSTALHNAFIFQRTQQQAITDGLTGLKTHRYFMESVQAEWKRATRTGRIFSIIALDLDRFKQINDTMGHLEGDLVLTRLGRLLEHRCRQSNVVARYGGDEFMILMPEATTDQAQILAERLRLWIATDSVFAERRLTGSFGLATYPVHGETPEDIVRASDTGLYLSKHRGGNMVSVAEQFRRNAEPAGWRANVLYTYLESLGRRLEATGPEAFEALLRRVEEAWPAFPGDPLEQERAVLEGTAALADALDRRVHGTATHMSQTARYAMLLAAELPLSERELDELQGAARIHDVGYIAVPSAVLTRPGRLTSADFAAMQAHAGAGARLLETMRVNPAIVAIVHYHHEFYNGTGYPDGLAAEDIPLGARILAVADSFDAITSDRPHRRARSVVEALDELERFAGTQFDPALVKAFTRTIRAEAGAPAEISKP